MGSPYFATHGYASPLTPVIQDSHPDLPEQRATGLHQDNQRLAGLPSCVTPSLAYYRIGSHAPPTPASRRSPRQGSDGQHHRPRHGRTTTGTGISTRPPSTTPDGLALGPGSPWAEQPGPGTLGHPAAEILTLHSLLMPAFSLPHPPHLDHSGASPDAGRSPTQHPHPQRTGTVAAASAVCLSPATLSAQDHLTSELLRTLSRVAASKPTSWLSRRSHILSHLAHT